PTYAGTGTNDDPEMQGFQAATQPANCLSPPKKSNNPGAKSAHTKNRTAKNQTTTPPITSSIHTADRNGSEIRQTGRARQGCKCTGCRYRDWEGFIWHHCGPMYCHAPELSSAPICTSLCIRLARTSLRRGLVMPDLDRIDQACPALLPAGGNVTLPESTMSQSLLNAAKPRICHFESQSRQVYKRRTTVQVTYVHTYSVQSRGSHPPMMNLNHSQRSCLVTTLHSPWANRPWETDG
ncbi:hypothetical protein A9K55_006589, partial [Cordyceps militaris]